MKIPKAFLSNAQSESALNEYAKKCKEDFTKPSGIAQGWRACYEWYTSQPSDSAEQLNCPHTYFTKTGYCKFCNKYNAEKDIH